MAASPQQNVGPLGTRLGVYKPSLAKIIVLAMLMLILGVPCAIYGIKTNTSSTVYDSASNSPPIWFMSAGFILILCGIIAMILVLRNRKLRADVYEQGFVATNKQGVARAVRWDQVTQVWHKLEEIKTTLVKDPQTGESTPKTSKDTSIDVYAVQCADGITCEMDTSFYGLNTFGPFLEQTYLRYLFPRVLASYQAGTPLSFGTLSVSPAGISNQASDGNAELAWGSFQAIEVEKQKGAISVRRGSESQPWSTISISDTPNIAVFEALVNTIAPSA